MSSKKQPDLSLPVVIPGQQSKAKEGRPTKYHPIFCFDVIEHMRRGGSITSFPGYLYRKHKIKINPDTIYAWKTAYPEFSEALELGKSCALDFYEQVSIKAMQGRLKTSKKDGSKPAQFHFKVWALSMVNKFDWKLSDRKQIDDSIAKGMRPDTVEAELGDKKVTVNLIIPDNGRKNS